MTECLTVPILVTQRGSRLGRDTGVSRQPDASRLYPSLNRRNTCSYLSRNNELLRETQHIIWLSFGPLTLRAPAKKLAAMLIYPQFKRTLALYTGVQKLNCDPLQHARLNIGMCWGFRIKFSPRAATLFLYGCGHIRWYLALVLLCCPQKVIGNCWVYITYCVEQFLVHVQSKCDFHQRSRRYQVSVLSQAS